MVSIEKLSVIYLDGDHKLLALEGIDITMEPGRIMALVGESGSGKTTLGKSIMGLLPDNAEISGSVKVDDREIIGLDENSLNKIRWSKVAMVFQNGAANLNPAHAIVDQVAEPLIQHDYAPKRAARERAYESLGEMGIRSDQADRFPHELSGGEVQRALMAMAMIMEPELLILDEPTSALDAMTKAFVARVIDGMREKGASVLLITHDLDLAAKLANDLIVLYLGNVMEIMPAKDLFHNCFHPYTMALCRSYPGMETTRDLGGIRGDAFYRISHVHPRTGSEESLHTHVVGPLSSHEDGHAPPIGCLFHPRCTQVIADCRRKDVPLTDVKGHRVRCLRGGIANRIELKEIGKSYRKIKALCPTNLDLRAGEILSIVGETGSGKTTLAMITAGVLTPDMGHRSIDGEDMDELIKRDYRSLAGKIGVVYQNPAEAVSHRMTVFDIVGEPLRIQGIYKDKDEVSVRVKRALADVRLSTDPAFLKRYPHELNMGAIQRLCIARAMILEPSLLVADEPTSSLDPSVQAKILKLLMDLQTEKGLTMLFVTHDIGLARKISDRIGVMLAGVIVEMGPTAPVMGNPLHPYTSLLIRSSRGDSVNFLPITEPRDITGCPFASRCGHARTVCYSELPPQVNLDSGSHMVRCFFRDPLGGG